jgi:hypothetical protein
MVERNTFAVLLKFLDITTDFMDLVSNLEKEVLSLLIIITANSDCMT